MQARSVFLALCVMLLAFFSGYASATEAYATMDMEVSEDVVSSSVSDTASSLASATARPNGLCDICRYVIENKQRRQPYLCRGLKDINYQKYCVRVMESLMWWIDNQVYWVNYGCERINNGAKEWVRPCPADAICSWLQDFEIKDSFCPADVAFPKPE